MKRIFSLKEIIALFEAMEEGKIHYCKLCQNFVHDNYWARHISGDASK